MRVYILGICGTFMGGIARLATELGHEVCGSDANIYPPMSTQLQELGVRLVEGYEPEHMVQFQPDIIIVGNALSRGNPSVEAVLNGDIRFVSGPQWLYEHILQQRWVVAIAGTHGKTTTASMVCWLLEYAGLAPGFLIGGVPENFGVSARLGDDPFFVIEADEYDTAFFDKRSKFVHYHPNTLILNNLEYDHADIFDDLAQIKKQFHHLVRIVPEQGLIVVNQNDPNLEDVLQQGYWSELQAFSVSADSDWSATPLNGDFSKFKIRKKPDPGIDVESPLIGEFNMSNTLAAVAAVHHTGVPVDQAALGISGFKSVKRRMQLLATIRGISIYDDFAHHPTAIQQTLQALRQRVGSERIIGVLEPRSNTMLLGRHQDSLGQSLDHADYAYVFSPQDADWNMAALNSDRISVRESVPDIVNTLANTAQSGDHILIMSNGSFANIHQKLIAALDVTN